MPAILFLNEAGKCEFNLPKFSRQYMIFRDLPHLLKEIRLSHDDKAPTGPAFLDFGSCFLFSCFLYCFLEGI